MKSKNNSEFISKVNAFQEEMQDFIEKSDKKCAIIIIASEPDENGEGSHQTGSALGNEGELILALSGFMRNPQMLDLLKSASILSAFASASRLSKTLNSKSNPKGQEEEK